MLLDPNITVNNITHKLGICLIAFFLCFQSLNAQGAPDAMGQSELYTHTNNLIKSNNLIEAVPYLKELINRYKDMEEKQSTLWMLRYYLGVAHMHLYNKDKSNRHLGDAIAVFDMYISNNSSGKDINKVYEKKADCLLGMKNYKAAGKEFERMYAIAQKEETESVRSKKFLKKIINIYYRGKLWEVGKNWFLMALQKLRDPEDRALAATCLIEIYSKDKDIEKILKLLPIVKASNKIRFSLPTNLQFIKLGDQATRADDHDMGIFFYSNVYGLSKIIEYNDISLEKFRGQQKKLLMMNKIRSEKYIEIGDSIMMIEEQLKWLNTIPDYEAQLSMKKARAFFRVDRVYEAYSIANYLLKNFPDFEIIEDVYYLAHAYAKRIDQKGKMKELGIAYLDRYRNGKFKGDFVMSLGSICLEEENYEKFFPLLKTYVDNNDVSIYSQQCLLLLGTAYMKTQDYQEMIDVFEGYKEEKMKDSPSIPDLTYWTALAYLVLGEYSEALGLFQDMQGFAEETANPEFKIDPDSLYVKDSAYRIGLCHMGLDDNEKAKKAFLGFIERFPKSSLRGEVEYFLGEIYYGWGELDPAVEHYQNVPTYTKNLSFIEKSYFQRGEIYWSLRKYQPMVDSFAEFLKNYPDSSMVTSATFEQSRGHVELQRADLVCKAYEDALFKFGDDIENAGVDKILDVYVGFYKDTKLRVEQTVSFLDKALVDDDFRNKLVNDKGFLYEFFFKENADFIAIDERLYPLIREGDKYENKEAWEELRTVYVRQRDSFSFYTT